MDLAAAAVRPQDVLRLLLARWSHRQTNLIDPASTVLSTRTTLCIWQALSTLWRSMLSSDGLRLWRRSRQVVECTDPSPSVCQYVIRPDLPHQRAPSAAIVLG
jgi:hypothetical protein